MKYYKDNLIKEEEIRETCSTHGEDEISA